MLRVIINLRWGNSQNMTWPQTRGEQSLMCPSYKIVGLSTIEWIIIFQQIFFSLRLLLFCRYKLFVHWELKLLSFLVDSFLNIPFVRYQAQILRQYFEYCEYFFCLFVFFPFIQQAWSVRCKSRWNLIYDVKKLFCRKQQND